MTEIFFKFSEFYGEKNLTKILQLFNFAIGKALRFKAPISSLFWRQSIQSKNEGQGFE